MKILPVLVLAAVLVAACDKKKDDPAAAQAPAAPPVAPAQYIPSNGKYCFLQVTGKDSLMLTTEVKGDSVKGSFHWLPYEKDKKTGNFKGHLTGNTAHAISDVLAEGTVNREELIFTLQDSAAAVKFGEMLQGDNGVWMYKNKKAAREQLLKKTDCKN